VRIVSRIHRHFEKEKIPMKYVRTMINTVVLLAAVSVPVKAQERPIVTATVPFAFTLENTDLPAGTYTVSILSPYNMIKVQSADGRKVAWIGVIPSLKSEESKQVKLVFHRFGNEYFLAQVWEQGSKVHRDLRSGNRARELARNGDRMQFITILANTGNDSHS
jgi:hypothetical protein